MRRLPTRDRERIVAKIEQYARDPASLARQVTPLTGSDYQHLRVGSYRVIFDFERCDSRGPGHPQGPAPEGSV